jgi:preprotein translocase subunit YajC
MTAALIYLAILVVAFFFLIVLPQRRRMSAHRALVDAMAVGDEIVTTAGIHGTVRALGEATLQLEIAPGVVVTLARGAVSQRRRPDPDTSAMLEVDETPAVDGSPVEPRPPTPRPAD